MSDMLVCPECGSAESTQRRYVAAEYTVNVCAYGIEDVSEEILDSGERDAGDLTCADCGEIYGDPAELIPSATYDDEVENA